MPHIKKMETYYQACKECGLKKLASKEQELYEYSIPCFGGCDSTVRKIRSHEEVQDKLNDYYQLPVPKTKEDRIYISGIVSALNWVLSGPPSEIDWKKYINLYRDKK